MLPERPLLSLSTSCPDLLPSVARLLESVAIHHQVDDQHAAGLSRAVTEACRNAFQHAFDPGEAGEVELVISKQANHLVFSVRDRGLPFDAQRLEDTGRGGVGSLAMHKYADEVRVKNLGPEGMRVELIKVLPVAALAEETSAARQPEKPPADLEFTIRPIRPDEALLIARAAYRTYGYTYAAEVYNEEMVAMGLEVGYLLAMGAFVPNGDMVGMLAVLVDDPEAPVGELGLGMVDPPYRGRHLFEKMLGPTLDAARQKGMVGLFAETVTVHTITQKGKHDIGWRETGVVLAYIAERRFKAIAGGEPQKRQTIVLYYATLNPGPERTVYPPPRHREIIEKIYRENKLTRTVAEGAGEPQGEGQLELAMHPQQGTANLSVTAWGADTVDQVKAQLRDLLLKHVDLIMLDLPLGDPATATQCARLEELGFFLAGVVPELSAGDVLRLQYLHDVEVDPSVIKIYSPFGQELFDYVMAARPAAVR